ncbi:TetR/AcrR family transcriptional regulator [Mycolicibacterium houstonense]|uniref:TetR/AcrR family transcriptional regulator n=1 Tax=Mycolicibacterium houstonense TaxID=146021 RepID=UPI003F9E387D
MAEKSLSDRAQRRRMRTAGPIMDAAERLFAVKGLTRTTVDEIATAADVSVGTVYFHFESKDGLYLALVERALDVNEEYMARVDRDSGPFDRVLQSGDCYLRFFLDHPDKFRIVVLRVLEPSSGGTLEDAERRIAARVRRIVGNVEADLAEARDAGLIRDVDVPTTMQFLWGAWNGVIALALRQDDLALSFTQLEHCLELGRGLIRDALQA